MPSMFATMFSSLLSLFLCMAVGYLCRKIKIIDDAINVGLSGLLVKVTLPCTAFMSMQRDFTRELLAESFVTLGVSFVVFLSGAALATLLAVLLKAKPVEKNIWQFSLTFANVGYAGFPIMLAVYQNAGLIYTSMANVAFNVLAFTFGIRLFNREKAGMANLRLVLLNPALIATALGFVFFLTSLRLPGVLSDGISLLGNMTTPLSMLVVGSILAKNDIRKVFVGWKMYIVIFMRLVLIPVLVFLILHPFIKNSVMLGVLVLLPAMPVASLTAIFAQQYKGNTELASKMIFVSTLASLLTIPLVTLLLG